MIDLPANHTKVSVMRRLAALALLATTAIGCDSSADEPSPEACGHSERYAGSGEFDEQSSMVVGETAEVGIRPRPSDDDDYVIEFRISFDQSDTSKLFTVGTTDIGCDGNFAIDLLDAQTGDKIGEAEGQVMVDRAQGSWELTTGQFGTWSAQPYS